MSDKDIRSISLFFFFAFLDEKLARAASIKAISLCQKKLKKAPDTPTSVVLVSSTNLIWEKLQSKVNKGRAQVSVESGWLLPDYINLAPWKEFQKKSGDEECLALIWSRILKVSDEDISKGLGVTLGTVRYRVGKALRLLGSMTQPGSISKVSKA